MLSGQGADGAWSSSFLCFTMSDYSQDVSVALACGTPLKTLYSLTAAGMVAVVGLQKARQSVKEADGIRKLPKGSPQWDHGWLQNPFQKNYENFLFYMHCCGVDQSC